MAETPPPGIVPIFLRGVTCEKFGLKTGEGVLDLVDMKEIPKEDIEKEISVMGKMSDWEPAKKHIADCPLALILLVVDKSSKYGETFLLCVTPAAADEFLKKVREEIEAREFEKNKAAREEEERKAAEFARLNAVFEDKPVIPKPWKSTTMVETENEVAALTRGKLREDLGIDITRPKRYTKMQVKLVDKPAESFGVQEFRPYKDPNFKPVKEADSGIQASAIRLDSSAQTNWNRPVNRATQVSSDSKSNGISLKDIPLLEFLERATLKIETSLQQNETIDIHRETFRILGEDENAEGNQAENELREIKNFADPTYSKSKALSCIDWMPKTQGILAVSAVRNISFDQRVTISGQTFSSHVLLWDFKQLVKPLVLLQSQQEIFVFKFNKTNPNIIVGGNISGQVVLWDISLAMKNLSKKTKGGEGDEDETANLPINPKWVSTVEFSHKKCVSDLFWLPPSTQINYRGQLVSKEHLDGNCYQFVTVSSDGYFLIWDTRYEQIALDEVKFIARSKHIPVEKTVSKDQLPRPLWAPIYRVQLKRLEGVGELSLNRIVGSGCLKPSVAEETTLGGDYRHHFTVTSEEGDIVTIDLGHKKEEGKKKGGDDEEDEPEVSDISKEITRWFVHDHPRPSVGLQQSPFFSDIVLSISDWSFHIWKIGDDRPLFTSPLSNTYMTAGCWSPTRPAVILVACADGNLLAWDFTDSSFHPSIELKATHAKITSIEFLTANPSSKQQLLAAGDETGTLHVFEMPRNLVKPVNKEDVIMSLFLERELQRNAYIKASDVQRPGTAAADPNLSSSSAVGDATVVPTETVADALLKAEADAIAKEEAEFAKMELQFIQDLGFKASDLPDFARNVLPPPPPQGK